ncbi:hypothetical protein D3C85_1399320 [compost metagenome]
MRPGGRRAPGQIGGRAGDHEAYVRTDAHRGHVPGDFIAQAHAHLVPVRDDIGESGIQGDLDLDLGVLGKQRREPGPKHGLGRIFRRGDSNSAGRLVAQLRDRGQLCLDLLEAGGDVLHQSLSGFRRGDAARGPREQPDTHPGLKRTDRVAQRRLGNAELRRRACEASLMRNGNESQQVVVAVSLHL